MSRRRLMMRRAGASPVLPNGYRKVKCITIPEGGFINTGLPPTRTSEITITARINSTLNVNRAIWYSREGGKYFAYVNAYGSGTGFCYQLGIPYINDVGTKDNNKHTFYSKGITFVIDDAITATLPSNPQTQIPNKSILLAARKDIDGTGYEQCSNLTVWSYQHNSDTQRSQTLIPCERLSDHAFGLFDLEANTFIGNSGTGVITEGVE